MSSSVEGWITCLVLRSTVNPLNLATEGGKHKVANSTFQIYNEFNYQILSNLYTATLLYYGDVNVRLQGVKSFS